MQQPSSPQPQSLTATQQAAIAAPGSLFLQGQAGSGKTTALLHRLARLLQEGESPYSILILLAEAADRRRIHIFLQQQLDDGDSDGLHHLHATTFTYLAREMVQQFWPLIARPAGFERPFQPPRYIHYDMAQLLMWRIVGDMLNEGAFAGITMRPQQIVSQALDNLNRAALNRLSLDDAAQRQLQSAAGEPDAARHIRDAMRAAQTFRAHCRRHSLIDVSLAVRVFDTQLLQHPEFHRYFRERFRHLLVDNVEEQTAAGQQFVASLLDVVQSAAIVHDHGGGYKQLLSAHPGGAAAFGELCRQSLTFEQQFVSSTPLVHLANAVENRLLSAAQREAPLTVEQAPRAILDVAQGRYRHEMAQNAVQRLADVLMRFSIAPQDAAIITPGLDGALRYTLAAALRREGLPFSLLRRRSSPRDEPLVRAWLTLLALAHPEWQRPPPAYDVAEALSLTIAGLDPARATLLTEALYEPSAGVMAEPAALDAQLVERAGEQQVEALQQLLAWLEAHSRLPLPDFLQQLTTALQSPPAFQDHEAAPLAAWLTGLATRLLESAPAMELEDAAARGRALLAAVDEGLVTTDPPEMSEPPLQRGVLVTTIHGYLLSQETSRVQLWFDVSSPTWWDIPQQPLSNPFVLAPDWPAGRAWTLADAYQRRNEMLSHIIRGLAVRCRDGVILSAGTLDQRGQRQDSPLWRALQPLIDDRPQQA